MKRIVLTCAALLLSGQALADDCANANTQIEMNTCAAEQFRRPTPNLMTLIRMRLSAPPRPSAIY